jgi:molybdopterin-synthase adenylyltransferase
MTQHNLNINSPFFHEERHAPLAQHAAKLITICGAGTLGANLAETLARMGFTHLRVIDKDRVEMRNLSVQPYSRAEIGAPKARALANLLYRAVQAKVEPIVTELTEASAPALLQGSALVVDAFDNHLARAAVNLASRAAGHPCLHIGFSPDGLYGSGIWEPDYRVPRETPGDPCDYPLTRPFALALNALAARALSDFFRLDVRHEFEMTWNDLKILYRPILSHHEQHSSHQD